MEQNTIEKKLTFDLINGNFSPQETMEIINHIIQKKINFHKLKSFSDTIRFGTKNEQSSQRIEVLLSYQTELKNYIENLIDTNQPLDIKATITIVPNQSITD